MPSAGERDRVLPAWFEIFSRQEVYSLLEIPSKLGAGRGAKQIGALGMKSLASLAVIGVVVIAAAFAVLRFQNVTEGAQTERSQTQTAIALPTIVLAEQGNFYAGGQYDTEYANAHFIGQIYVEYRIPEDLRHPFPIVLVHGGGVHGATWFSTPDGRPGWAQYFLRQGYAVYVVDQV